jgi:hypothetical protein
VWQEGSYGAPDTHSVSQATVKQAASDVQLAVKQLTQPCTSDNTDFRGILPQVTRVFNNRASACQAMALVTSRLLLLLPSGHCFLFKFYFLNLAAGSIYLIISMLIC